MLVLDDDPAVLHALRRLLTAYGYAPATASTLDEAAGIITRTRIDAVIVDVRLGGGTSGLDLLRTIRQRRDFDAAPLLVLTGAVLSEDEETLITSHRAYLFRKPEGFRALLGFLDTLTERDQPH